MGRVNPAYQPSVIITATTPVRISAPPAPRALRHHRQANARLSRGERGQDVAAGPRANGRFHAPCADHSDKGVASPCVTVTRMRSPSRVTVRTLAYTIAGIEPSASNTVGFDRHDKTAVQASVSPRPALSVEHQATRPRKAVSPNTEATNSHSCNKTDVRRGLASQEDQTSA